MESIIGYGNPRIGRQASDGSFTAPDALWDVILNYYLMNAGDITVTCSEDFVHVELPAISMSGSAPYNLYDMDGTTRISIDGGAMSFSGNGLYANGNHYSCDLTLDAPVTISESYDIWDGQAMDTGTCTATLNSQASFSFSFDLNDNGEVDYVYIQLTPYWDYKTGAGVEIRDSGRDTWPIRMPMMVMRMMEISREPRM